MTDVRPTDNSINSGPAGLKIYFADEESEDRHDRKLTDKKDVNRAQDKLHRLLLTSTEEKQVNSRHDLYKNPKILEIKFRTESPSSLRTVASPLLVQNSVKNRLVQNSKKRLREKRAARGAGKKAKDKTVSKGNVWPKAFSVNGASWFKRYQALYNDMMKRRGQETLYNTQPVNYYQYDNQIQSNAQRNAIPNAEYYYNYIYPLYHLHPENQHRNINQNDNIWRKNQQTMQLRSQDIVPGTHPTLTSKNMGGSGKKYASVGLSSSHIQRTHLKQNQNILSRHLLQDSGTPSTKINIGSKMAPYIVRNNSPYHRQASSFIAIKHHQIPEAAQAHLRNAVATTQEHALHSIGLRDDASFMEASPNYDSSVLTLHAMQSLIPRAQLKSVIPQTRKTPIITTKNSLAAAKTTILQNSLAENKKIIAFPDNGRSNLQHAMQDVARMNGEGQRDVLPTNTFNNKLLLIKSGKGDMPGNLAIGRSEIARPNKESNAAETNAIALSFYKAMEKPKIEFPPENNDENRDTIYKIVSPVSDIDSDGVTAENLAAIFNELDGQLDDALHNEVAKKDSVARPQDDVTRSQNEIEMTVYDTSENTPIKKSGVQFVTVDGSNGVETNLQQSLDIPQIEKDESVGSLKDTIIKPRFDLKRLHFGLRNGNTFE